MSSMEGIALDQVTFHLNIRRMSNMVMSIPLIGIIICFISANIFHEDINHTRCPVYNFIPSVSAVTGVSPQRYLWRLCVALHIIPRSLFAWLCYQHSAARAGAVSPGWRRCYRRLVLAAFTLNVTELASLAGVTYVSNKENYPLHEKLFSLFIGSCSTYMLLALLIERLSGGDSGPHRLRSCRCKLAVFLLYCSLVLGLLYNFWKHRFYCEELAFTWFAFCEYCICMCIMVFHVLVLRDIPDVSLAVGRLLPVDDGLLQSKSQ